MLKRLNYANVVATIALFLALGGTSYAVTALPKNSVGTTQLRANAVTSAKVKNKSLTIHDLAASARTALQGRSGPAGAAGAAGPAGPAGATGPAGKDGANGLSRALTKVGPALTAVTTTSYNFTATPGAGTYVVTGDTELLNLKNVPVHYTCQITSTNDAAVAPQRSLFLSQLGGVPEIGTITATRTITVGATDQVSLHCINSGGLANANYEVHTPQLTLIPVDAATPLP